MRLSLWDPCAISGLLDVCWMRGDGKKEKTGSHCYILI